MRYCLTSNARLSPEFPFLFILGALLVDACAWCAKFGRMIRLAIQIYYVSFLLRTKYEFTVNEIRSP